MLSVTYIIRNEFFIKFNSNIYARYLFKRAGANIRIKAGAIIDSPENLEAGDNFNLGEYSFIAAQGGIIIGHNVIIGHHVSILSSTHALETTDIPIAQQGMKLSGIVIENDVWIGSGARILPGIHIGSGAVIGTNAVVTKDVEPFMVVGGVPAVLIRKRK